MPQSSHLLGYNNNVRHRGQIFHIQTEDSGVNAPRINTHLFADGGRIVRSTRIDYSAHLLEPDLKSWVKAKMKEQHKKMFVALRSGSLDETLGFTAESVEEKVSNESLVPLSMRAESIDKDSASQNAAEPHASQESEREPLVQSVARVKQELVGGRPSLSEDVLPLPSIGEANIASLMTSTEASEQAIMKSGARTRKVVANEKGKRPAAQYAAARGSHGLFGEKEEYKDSLGDAIRSYLSDEEVSPKS